MVSNLNLVHRRRVMAAAPPRANTGLIIQKELAPRDGRTGGPLDQTDGPTDKQDDDYGDLIRSKHILHELCNHAVSTYRNTGVANKVCKTQLSRTQAVPCSIAKEEQKQISSNHVQALFAGSVETVLK